MDKKKELLLVEKLKCGDSKAVALWFKSSHKFLLGFALKKIEDKKIAEELVQETFINCLKNLNLFKFQSSFKTWMYGILKHEVADYYRKLYAKKTIRCFPLGDFMLACPIEDAHGVSEKVKLVLTKMAKEKAELLFLKYVDQHKVREIAQKTGKTVKAVESDLFRAREEFRALYLETNY